MNVDLFITPILIWIVAAVIASGKANFLIAGYNTSSDEEKAGIDEKKLSKFMGRFLFVLGVIQLAPGCVKLLGAEDISSILTGTNILFLTAVISGIIYMNTGDRFKKL